MAAKSLKTLEDETNGARAACAAHIAAHAPALLKNGAWLAQFGASALLPRRVSAPLNNCDGAVNNGPDIGRANAKMRAPCLV